MLFKQCLLLSEKETKVFMKGIYKLNEIVDFLIAVGKLKGKKRRGWLLHQIKNPESTASHSFRTALLAWFLARKKKDLNLEKVLKIALIHDICEVYTWDETPYDPLIPRDVKKQEIIQKILDKWPNFTLAQKKRKAQNKYRRERRALEKLVLGMPKNFKKEILNLWEDFEKGLSKEGVFVKQVDKLENYLQGMEYWKKYGKIRYKLWARWIREVLHDPLLLEFVEEIERKFYKKNKKSKNKELNFLLEFFLKIGKLKDMVRSGWILREVKNGSTVAEDAFLLGIAILVLNERKKLNLEKMLKMSLVYEICEVYSKDKTPYEKILPKNKLARKKVLERWPRFSSEEKKRRFIADYKDEKKSLEKLCAKLPEDLKKEIIYLWDDCKRRRTLEGNFVNQIYWVAMMGQALQYWKRDKNFPIIAWMEQMKEFLDDPIALEVLEGFYQNYF